MSTITLAHRQNGASSRRLRSMSDEAEVEAAYSAWKWARFKAGMFGPLVIACVILTLGLALLTWNYRADMADMRWRLEMCDP